VAPSHGRVTDPSGSPRPRLAADLVLVAITAVWGGSFVVVKDALVHADPFVFLALRFTVGALVATGLAAGRLRHPGVVRAGLVLGLFLFLGFSLQTVGLVYTTEARSAFITGMAVVLVPLLSIAVFRRIPQAPSIAGVGIAAVGLFILTGGLSDPAIDGAAQVGDLLTLGCAASFAMHIALTEKFAPGRPALALVAVQLWVVALLGALCVPLAGARVGWRPDFLAAVLFSGAVSSAGCIALQTWAQARTTAVRAALIFALEPVFAAMLAVALGRERLDAREVLGGSLTLLAVLVAEVGNLFWTRRTRASGASEH
jgi:drug/metabolite transporter (DMT)-like permease